MGMSMGIVGDLNGDLNGNFYLNGLTKKGKMYRKPWMFPGFDGILCGFLWGFEKGIYGDLGILNGDLNGKSMVIWGI